jgi:hypothetical protein
MRSLSSLCVSLVLASGAAAQLTVVSVDPPLNASNRAANTSIVVDFDRALDPASLDHFKVYASAGGPVQGSKTLENGDTRVRFEPLNPFLAGEIVWTLMSEDLAAQDGSFLRTEGFAASFRVGAAPAPRAFTLNQSWDVSPGIFARIYGGQNCDLDGDGFIDMSVICENSSDVRVYLSNDDGTGTFGAMLSPLNPVGTTPSPNESSDFDGDGHIDIVTAEQGGSVSVLLGNGDGTFASAVTYPLGNPTYGLAVFEADGDGDMDIAAPSNDQVRLLLNQGDGTFAPPIAIPTAVSNDYGLTSADMDNDGIVDLVVGSVTGQIMVLRSNGNGTFTQMPVQNAGGHAWMIVCGDLDGDGNMDATVANGGNGRGSRLLGNGNGTFQAPFTTPQIGWMTATDLGDLDGDGDLDWVLSSFGAGVYQMYVNDGAGGFTLDQTIPAIQNPACCAIFDADGDRDMDLALFDEIADIVRIMENGALEQQTYCFGTAAACPCGNAGAAGHGCENSSLSGGALILGQGQASVANDSLALNAGGLPASTTLVFLQGTSQAGGGLGTPFGDGLLCVGSTVVRLASKTTVNGFASLGAGNPGDLPISQLGSIPAAGGQYFYQAWFRNTDAFCTSATFNLSNGVSLTWTP